MAVAMLSFQNVQRKRRRKRKKNNKHGRAGYNLKKMREDGGKRWCWERGRKVIQVKIKIMSLADKSACLNNPINRHQ